MGKTFNMVGGVANYIINVKNAYPNTTVTVSSDSAVFIEQADSNGNATVKVIGIGTYSISAPYKYAYSQCVITSTDRIKTFYLHNVPTEYQEVEYLESTGTQYIDTGIILNQDCQVKMKYALTRTGIFQRIFGARQGSDRNRFVWWISTSSYKYYFDYGDGGQPTNDASVDTNIHNLFLDGPDAYFDGQLVQTHDVQTFTTPNSAYVFWYSGGGGEKAEMRLYQLEINKDGLAGLYVPCYRKSDEVVGLWDAVTNTLFTNAGTGAFNVGGDVNV